ncbi:MAG: hypothetical protein ACLSVD_13420 [Eggerthellaceae bacterium]
MGKSLRTGASWTRAGAPRRDAELHDALERRGLHERIEGVPRGQALPGRVPGRDRSSESFKTNLR